MNVQEFLKDKLESNQTVLTEFESKKLLEDIGIVIPLQELTSSKEETVSASEKIGFPVVLKLMAEDIVHKSDTGAVKLNLKNKEEVEGAYDELTHYGINNWNDYRCPIWSGSNVWNWRYISRNIRRCQFPYRPN